MNYMDKKLEIRESLIYGINDCKVVKILAAAAALSLYRLHIQYWYCT